MNLYHVTLTAFLATSLTYGLTGCQQPSTDQEEAQTEKKNSESDHGHPHEEEGGHTHGVGPHGGTVADWGGGAYHVEFTVDHGKKEATVYVLGGDQKTPAPVAAENVLLTIKEPSFQAELKPAPLKGDPDGKASRFSGTHDELATVQEFSGTISAQVDGTPYAGNFAEEAHGHEHGHSHSGADALVWEGAPKQHEGLTIKLGHHGEHLHAGEEIEPAVSITSDGKPVSDAKVFNALVSPDGETVLAEEVATVFEPTTEEEPAHYAQGSLKTPSDAKEVIVRFRIEPAGLEPVTYDMPLTLE